MNYYYRELRRDEEHPYERSIGNDAVKFISLKNKLAQPPELRFVVEDRFGEHELDSRVLGFAIGSRRIFICAALDTRNLIQTIAHEVRHCWQVASDKYCRDSATRERDCWLYEHEIELPPGDASELRRWLWLELAFAENPGLRELYARTDAMMAHRQAPAPKASEVRRLEYAGRPKPVAANPKERIAYIRKLLGQLPNEPKYNGQRSRLAEELAELTRGIAA